MIAFRIHINREEAVIAGLSGQHVVSIHADWRERCENSQRSSESPTGFRLSASGLRTSEDGSGTHISWLSTPLTVGDEITIAVVEVPASEISPPTDERRGTGVSESRERERLAFLLMKYGAPAGT